MDNFKAWELSIKSLTLVGALIAGIWTIGSYLDSKEKEFYTDFWNKKMDLFQKASVAASTVATTSNLKEFNKARSDYWKLYYGELSLVEGACVKQAMIVFSNCVPEKEITESKQLPLDHIKQPAYRLTKRLKEELARSWENPFSELNLSKLPERCEFPEEEICLTRQPTSRLTAPDAQKTRADY